MSACIFKEYFKVSAGDQGKFSLDLLHKLQLIISQWFGVTLRPAVILLHFSISSVVLYEWKCYFSFKCIVAVES